MVFWTMKCWGILWLSHGFHQVLPYMHLQTPQKIQGTAMSVESLFGRTTCGLSMHPFLTSSAGMLRCSLENGGVRGPFRFWSVWFWHQLFFEQTKGPLMSTFPPAEVIGCSQTWITIQKDPERLLLHGINGCFIISHDHCIFSLAIWHHKPTRSNTWAQNGLTIRVISTRPPLSTMRNCSE